MGVLQHTLSRHVARPCRLASWSGQRRWAQVCDVRFLTSSQQQRSEKILDRYREKLDKKAKQEGVESIDGLKEKYQDRISHLRKKASVPGATAPLTEKNAPYQPPPPPVPASPPTTQTAQQSAPSAQEASDAKKGIKTLSDFMDVDRAKDLTRKELEYGWRLKHSNNPQSLCAIIEADVYRRIATTAKKHPQFILPLPREGQGADIHFLQWTFPSETTSTVLFTNLAEFKLRGEFSQPHMTVTHHLELAEDLGVVLLQGSVLPDRGVSVDEGKFLLMCLQKFYSQTAEQTPRRKLLQQFTDGDADFQVDKLLEEAEKFP